MASIKGGIEMLNGYENIESYLDWLCNSEEYVEYKQALENSEMFKK